MEPVLKQTVVVVGDYFEPLFALTSPVIEFYFSMKSPYEPAFIQYPKRKPGSSNYILLLGSPASCIRSEDSPSFRARVNAVIF